jgi:hypothetical protein
MIENEPDASDQWQRPVGGVFITRGMTVGIPAWGISINDKNELDSDPIKLHVHFDVCPSWLELAFKHLLKAEERSTEVIGAWKTRDDERLSRATGS